MEDKLIYKFTKDTKFLRQYHRLRKIIYEVDLEMNISTKGDYIDKISETLVALNKNRCVGGARLTVCRAGENIMLPTESHGFRLRELLPELNLHKTNYAEFSRLVLASEYRDSKVSQKIYQKLNQKAKQLGVRYIFVITYKALARRYALSYRKLGYKIQELHDIAIPEEIKEKYDHVAECILMLDLKPELQVNPYKPEQNAQIFSMIQTHEAHPA